MANCANCGIEVGCSCNLHGGGLCTSCYSNRSIDTVDPKVGNKKKATKRVVYSKPDRPVPPNTEFTEILKNKAIPREEKIKRINDILEKARKQIEDDNKI